MAGNILVVDDDAEIRGALAQILDEEGFVVREAANGVEAMTEIARERPDLMLLDLMMPVMNGWQVLDALRRSHDPRFPVVVISAVPAEGCVDYITKPLQLDRLLLLLDTVRTRSMARIATPKASD